MSVDPKSTAMRLECQTLIDGLKKVEAWLSVDSLGAWHERPFWFDDIEPLLRNPSKLISFASGIETMPIYGTGRSYPCFTLVIAPSPEFAELLNKWALDEVSRAHLSNRRRLQELPSKYSIVPVVDDRNPSDLAGIAPVGRAT